MENQDSIYQAPEQQLQKKSNTGKIIGCGCLVIILLLIIGGYLGYRYIIGKLEESVVLYTEESVRELPKPNSSKQDADETIQKFDNFIIKVSNDEASEPLSLSAEEMNQLINYHPQMTEFSDKAYFEIDDNILSAEVSVPLDGLKNISPIFEVFSGRYLNGTIGLDLELRNERLEVYIESIEVKGNKVPEEYMQKVRTKNFAEEFNKDPEGKELLKKIESINISDGVIKITPKKSL